MRDPRIDPKPGDVFIKGKRKRLVCKVYPLGPVAREMEWVCFTTPSSNKGVIIAERPDIFIKWARTAEVLYA